MVISHRLHGVGHLLSSIYSYHKQPKACARNEARTGILGLQGMVCSRKSSCIIIPAGGSVHKERVEGGLGGLGLAAWSLL
jgi:hypothetical protein